MPDTHILTEEEKKAKALEHFTGKNPDETPAKTEQELADEKKAEEERVLAEAKKKEEEELALKNKNKPDAEVVEMSDEQLLELASKKSGRKITSWDDLKLSPTEEDKKKAEETRDSEKLTYGLKKGLFNKKQLESFIVDSKNPRELVYSRELAEAKAEDADWNEEKEKEFKDEFEEKFGINLDATSSKFKRGQKQLALISDSILKTEYAPILSLDAEFGKYESDLNSRKEQQQKILAAAPIYKADVESVIAANSKVEIDFGGEKYEVPVSKEMLDTVTEYLLETGFSANQIANGYKKENLQQIASNIIISQNFHQLAFEAAKKYREKHEKGVRGIPDGGKLEKRDDDNNGLTDNQKKALDFFKIAEKPVVAN